MLAIGRALMARPRLLLLDEPSLGLAPMVTKEVSRLIVSINREDKVGVVLVEQNSRMALRISESCLCVGDGPDRIPRRLIDLLENDHVRQLYLGG